MQDTTAYDALINRLFETTLDTAAWEDIPRLLEALAPGVRTQVFGIDSQDRGVNIATGAWGYDPYYADAFTTHYSHQNPWAKSFTTAEIGKPISAGEMYPEADLLRTEFYHDWVRPQEDIRGGGGIILDRTKRTNLLIGGNIRQRDRDRIEADWLALLARLAPLMRHAWTLGRTLATARLERDLLAAQPAVDPTLILLDIERRPGFTNMRGARMLEAGDILRHAPDGRVSFRDDQAQRRLAALSRSRPTPYRAADFLLPGGRGQRVRMSHFDPAGISSPALALMLDISRPGVLVVLSDDRNDLSPRDVAVTLGLTGAEGEVAFALYSGRGTDEIAQARGVGPGTVRNQLKSIFVKTGTGRQSELVSLIAALAR
ncbi:helix-turn-helix transcriptional regulator [Profundibacterium mesophilum]|uniref:DNA-binding HTH domain-containing protein Transcription n=1 Tax=Profundibacterium mesophilum KAUST100406-0324 TaxID=1037889 RepID=A0A921NUI6_9RHOB|nr:hypothetical protein [Profundibacterium mesophilum]KAF0676909.1 DNA-binding HTH domain-containing protein Transcription [Profundibacterium mesophilum KAUST100406-0324]